MWHKTISKVRYYLQYFPFTANAVLLAIGLWLAYRLLPKKDRPDSEVVASYLPLIGLMAKTALYFFGALLLLSILSTLVCWLVYIWLKLKKQFQINFEFTHQAEKKHFWLETVLPKVRRPLLGYVKARLIYDGGKLTDKFTLASNKRNPKKFWRDAISGRSQVLLPDIKEYEVHGGFIFFEDMLQLFSLPVKQKIQGSFFQPPIRQAIAEQDAQPKKTEQTDIRIEQLRKVEGELLNYKGFEHGDDVRRIVWKVYARNRELVVRIPETKNPYASHLDFYASFFCTGKELPSQDNSMVKELLNYFKVNIWTAFDALSQKEWDTRFIPDQSIQLVRQELSPEALVQRMIANAQWHQDKDLNDYFRPESASVLCISSYTDVASLSELLDSCSNDTLVYYVQLSKCFQHPVAGNWLLRLLLLPPQDRLKRLRTKWLFSQTRRQLLANEQRIKALLEQSVVTVGWL